jgi:PQQ-like domain
VPIWSAAGAREPTAETPGASPGSLAARRLGLETVARRTEAGHHPTGEGWPAASASFPMSQGLGRRIIRTLLMAGLVAACAPTSLPSTPPPTVASPSPSLAWPTIHGPSAVASLAASPTTAPAVSPSLPATPQGLFPGGLLVADRGNGRLIIVNHDKRIVWRFPVAGSLPRGQAFSADDAFLAPDGRTITANEEAYQVVVRIDVATRRVVWEYGHFGRRGSAPGYLNTPDDAYPLANGDVVIADIRNCRVIEVAPDKRIVRRWGRTGMCRSHPPTSYRDPNGDTPLPDGGLLITEIGGARVVRLDARGGVMFDIHVPAVYPSDAQLDPEGNVVLSDYTNPGAILAVSPRGRLLWRYGPHAGSGRLDHPSLALPLPDGTIVLNDDFRQRVLLLDPQTGRVLWQYGRTDRPGAGADRLRIPDGLDPVPIGTVPGL